MNISVILPIWNADRWLKDCLDNILLQTMDDFEVICVNDASSDKSKEILNEYHLKDKRIIVINHETNMRVAYSRNEAFKASSGKYIVYVDSDDLIIEKDFFKDCIEKFEANENVDIVIGKCLMVNNPKNLSFKELLAVQPVQMKAMNTFEQDAKQFNIASPKYLLLTKNAQMLWGRAFRKSFLEKMNISFPTYDEFKHFGTDTLVVPFTYIYAKKIDFIFKNIYLYNFHSSSTCYGKVYGNTTDEEKKKWIPEWYAKKIVELNRDGVLTDNISPLIKFLRKVYSNTELNDHIWLYDNLLKPYGFDLNEVL